MPLVRAINAGGDAVGDFEADNSVSGGEVAVIPNDIDQNGASNPAPDAVYQSERWGDFTYHIDGLTAGKKYQVRLHFAEIFWDSSGQRVFNVSINGNQVLSNFDILAEAGGKNKVIIKTYTATADSSGTITIDFSTITDAAKVSGIEIRTA